MATIVGQTAGDTVADIACYAAGTRITTPSGDVAIEKLVIGDLVVTVAGEIRPIIWIGRRSYAGRFLRANPKAVPIRFRAGCLGDRLPQRDLLVSPEHAMLIDGLLVPANQLVNGQTIVLELGCEGIDYIHLELTTHDVVLAEGAASETYLDEDNRFMFHNATEATGHAARLRQAYYAPRVESGYALEVIREKLASIALARERAA
jgi:hypothetical protein